MAQYQPRAARVNEDTALYAIGQLQKCVDGPAKLQLPVLGKVT